MRCATDGKYPRYIVWENVPGAFSSTRARTSSPSSKKSARSKDTKFILLDLRDGQTPGKSWQTISVSHGGYLMRSTGESPSAENVSTLSQILQAGVPEKYYLSPKACLGILRRLPPVARSCRNFCGRRWSVRLRLLKRPGRQPHGCDGGRCGNAPCGKPRASSLRDGGSRFLYRAFRTGQGIGYEKETSPTLRAGTVPAAVYENHSQDTRYTGPLETAPTVMSTYGTGGNNQPLWWRHPRR